MFYLRNMREYYQQVPRPTLVINHGQAVQTHLEQQRQLEATSSSASSGAASRAPVLGSDPQRWFRKWLPPLQSPYVRHHLLEHLPPLPSDATWAQQSGKGREVIWPRERLRLVRKTLADLIEQRGEVAHQSGPFHPRLAEINARIMQLREEQDSLDSSRRRAWLHKLHSQYGGVKPRVRGASGRGSLRGMLKQQLKEAPARAQKLAAAAQQRWLQRQQRLLDKYQGAQGSASPG
jgi:hypothetical protein